MLSSAVLRLIEEKCNASRGLMIAESTAGRIEDSCVAHLEAKSLWSMFMGNTVVPDARMLGNPLEEKSLIKN